MTATNVQSTRSSGSQHGGATANASERGQLLTADQLAERWQISTAHIYRLSRNGKIPCVPLGRYRRFRVESIEAFEIAQEASS